MSKNRDDLFNYLVEFGIEYGEQEVRLACKKYLKTRYPGVKKEKRKTISKEVRRQVYNVYMSICARCNSYVTWEDASVDHITPHSAGGSDSIENYALMHKRCNSAKGNRTLLEESKRTGKTFTELSGRKNSDKFEQ